MEYQEQLKSIDDFLIWLLELNQGLHERHEMESQRNRRIKTTLGSTVEKQKALLLRMIDLQLRITDLQVKVVQTKQKWRVI